MNILVADNQAYEELPVSAKLPVVDSQTVSSVVIGSIDSAFEIAAKINTEIYTSQTSLILINLHLANERFSTGDQVGADVLTFLRCAEKFYDKPNICREVPCVVYSVFPIDLVLRNRPENIILLSPGTGFFYPGNSQIVPELGKLQASKFDLGVWASSVKRAAFVPEDNHDLANWWGVRQLARVHSLVDDGEVPLPEAIIHELKKRSSITAASQYGFSQKSLSEAFTRHKHEIDLLRQIVSSRPLRILHIDDEWENGWSTMILRMFYPTALGVAPSRPDYDLYTGKGDRKLAVFKGFPDPSDEGALERMCNSVEQIIIKENCRLVLLDLRLFKEKDHLPGIGHLSGAMVLKYLREKFPGLPVIMTTASNKAWSLEKLLKCGADGFWIKEGLDKRNTAEESVRNYERLLELVSKTTGVEYQFLNSILKRIDLLTKVQRGGQWYSSKRWPNGTQTQLSEDDVKLINEILFQSISLMRAYLHLSLLGYGADQPQNTRFWFSAVIRHASGILEIIHRVPNRSDASIGELMFQRRDACGRWLNEIRNLVTHPSWLTLHVDALPQWSQLRDYFAILVAYLIRGAVNEARNIDPTRTQHYSTVYEELIPS